jgi:hypothetical protein
MTNLAGIPIPSTNPLFLAIVAVHILMGLTCVVAGAVAMLSPKQPGRHPTFGKVYFWCLSVVFATAIALSLFRWTEDYQFALLGTLAFGAALFGRTARRHRWTGWPRLHITGMGMSYVLLLTAFYVDNGKNLPFWKELPPIAFWIVPGLVGLPIIIWALLKHPVVLAQRPKD